MHGTSRLLAPGSVWNSDIIGRELKNAERTDNDSSLLVPVSAREGMMGEEEMSRHPKGQAAITTCHCMTYL